MDLYANLQLVVDLAEHGSFSAVAQLHNQAPSSISRKLDALEEHLEERLFNRTPNGVFLSEAGHRRLPEIQNLSSSAAAFLEKAPADGRYHGSISLAAPYNLGRDYITPVVTEFLRENPAVAVKLHFTDQVQNLDRERIDLAVRVAANNAGHHFIRKITTNRRILLASPKYLEKFKINRPSDLSGCEAINFRDEKIWHLQNSEGENYDLALKPRIQCLSADTSLILCVAGFGIYLRSYFEAKAYIERGELVWLLPQWQEAGASQSVSLVLPERRLLSKTVRAFAELLEQRLKETLPDAAEEI